MKKYLNPDSIANEIRMTRGQYKGAFLLVEGSTDALLFERLTNGRCKVIFSNGRDNAIKVVEILDSDNINGVLAIVDSDFWFLDGVDPPSPNILVTDGHDLETMLIFSEALERVLAEFGSLKSLQNLGIHVRHLLIKFALPLGLLRLMSVPNRKNLGLNFKEIRYYNFLDFDKRSVDVKQMVSEVMLNSRNSKLNAELLISELNTKLDEDVSEVEHICNGDDLVEILALGLSKVFGNVRSKSLNPHSLRSILRLAYDDRCFSPTNLHAGIKKWELLNPGFPVL
jgi:hypothetical protein